MEAASNQQSRGRNSTHKFLTHKPSNNLYTQTRKSIEMKEEQLTILAGFEHGKLSI